MMKLSLIALFAMSMATLTIAASYLPTPAATESAALGATTVAVVAEIG